MMKFYRLVVLGITFISMLAPFVHAFPGDDQIYTIKEPSECGAFTSVKRDAEVLFVASTVPYRRAWIGELCIGLYTGAVSGTFKKPTGKIMCTLFGDSDGGCLTINAECYDGVYYGNPLC